MFSSNALEINISTSINKNKIEFAIHPTNQLIIFVSEGLQEQKLTLIFQNDNVIT